MMEPNEMDDELEVVPAASIVRIDCPLEAARIGRWLAEGSMSMVSPYGEVADEAATAAALLRGELVLVRRAPPELDDYDGTAGRPLRELSEQLP